MKKAIVLSFLVCLSFALTAKADESEHHRAAVCTLTGGEPVMNGWSGHDTGSNFCNSCACSDGKLVCTKMACRAPMLSCTLTGGEIVAHGWSGKDTGANYCNNCACDSGRLICSMMGCPSPV